jgi:hypothetical protein
VNLTDVLIGWTFTRSIRNNAAIHVKWALQQAYDLIPYQVAGLDFDNGSEFINQDIITWAGDLPIYFTRSRPYKKNDQATIESKNNHLVRRFAGYWRYDTAETLRVLNRLWPLVNDRFNFLTPTKKPIGWTQDDVGRRQRVYDTPATPFDRLLAASVLSRAQEAELIAYRDTLNPAAIHRRITDLTNRLTRLAAGPTGDLLRQLPPTPRPAAGTGIILRPAS